MNNQKLLSWIALKKQYNDIGKASANTLFTRARKSNAKLSNLEGAIIDILLLDTGEAINKFLEFQNNFKQIYKKVK